MAEAIRLVVWDLDETFWHGTVTEGGLVWREDAAHAVRTLAARGIVSAICSKNDPAQIAEIMQAHGMDAFFVFNAVSWAAKGPRLAALVKAVQLRPETVLFIDDNPLNRAEAAHFVPGLQIADENAIAGLLEDDRLQGKADPDMTRLAQYKVLERRQAGQAQSEGDTAAFLRASNIAVRIEHDIGPHLDRAVELINRTNQLNFTKKRLPEDRPAARAALTALLAGHNIQAGLLHVRDDYGDYGFCGLYIMRAGPHGRHLLHFTFSCRILGLGVETWLYRHLKNPSLNVEGTVLTDVQNDGREIDWIGTGIALGGGGGSGSSETGNTPRGATRPLRTVLARGGCDMRAISHYFAIHADHVFEEFDVVRGGLTPMVNHSTIALQAMAGMDRRAIADFAPFGFVPEDFDIVLSRANQPGPAIWLLSFGIEFGLPMFRHRATGAMLPLCLQSLGPARNAAALMRGEDIGTVAPEIAAHLRAHFTYEGPLPGNIFKDTLRQIFARAAPDTQIFILLGNTHAATRARWPLICNAMHRQNTMIAAAATGFSNLELLAPASFMTEDERAALTAPQHYERMVYHRLFRHMMRKMGQDLVA